MCVLLPILLTQQRSNFWGFSSKSALPGVRWLICRIFITTSCKSLMGHVGGAGMSCPKTASEVHTCHMHLLLPKTCPAVVLPAPCCPSSPQVLTWDLLAYKACTSGRVSPRSHPWFYTTWGRLNTNRTSLATGQRNEAIKKAEFSQGEVDLLADGRDNKTAREKCQLKWGCAKRRWLQRD